MAVDIRLRDIEKKLHYAAANPLSDIMQVVNANINPTAYALCHILAQRQECIDMYMISYTDMNLAHDHNTKTAYLEMFEQWNESIKQMLSL